MQPTERKIELRNKLGEVILSGRVTRIQKGANAPGIAARVDLDIAIDDVPANRLDLEPIKAREQAATHGPWEVGDCECTPTELGLALVESSPYDYMKSGAWLHKPVVQTAWIHGQAQDKVWITGRGVSPYYEPNCTPHIYPYDAEFIAHARADIPALIAEVERLRERLDHIILVADRYIAANLTPPLAMSAVHVRRMADGTATTLPENDYGVTNSIFQAVAAQLKESNPDVATQ